jgi:anti-anti-sigma factor
MARLEISSQIMTDGTRVIKPSGQLDVFTFVELKRYFEELCAQAKDLLVVVDLSAVAYIASSGWTVLLSRRQALRRLGGDLSIFGLRDDIKRVYESMKIHKMLPAAENMTEAAKLLRAPDPAGPIAQEVPKDAGN